MASWDFRTDDEQRAIESAEHWRPELEKRDREIARLNGKIKKLESERDELRLKLDDALDRAVEASP